ncbi:MAG: CapA family protein [Prevotella sp.]|nr:CapA family protein [Prevotella sp.]
MKILIGADIVPTKSNLAIFESACMEKIVDANLLKILANADYRIFNLEVPLTDKEEPIQKCGPNLIASTASINGLKQLGVDFFTLANNHILDQGEQGLFSTIKVLQDTGIDYSGVGKNISEASKGKAIKLGEKNIGIYCCAEHEFSIATNDKAGANPFDPFDSLDHIAALKENSDYVICLYHGGKEHYRYPSPNLQKTCRKIVEKDANIVVCQHSHCIGCKEDYMSGTIIYGQGNFLFASHDNEFWQTSLLISIDLDCDNEKITYIPLQKAKNGVKLAVGADVVEILSAFRQRSQEIITEGKIETEYAKYAKCMVANYIVSNGVYSPFLFKAINKASGNHLRTWITNRKIKCHGVRMLNRYECEAHRELIIKGLRERIFND